MKYMSTRDKNLRKTSMEVIKEGISKDGGLFIPLSLASFSENDFRNMQSLDYRARAHIVLSKFLKDFKEDDLKDILDKAYGDHNFDDERIAPLKALDDSLFIQELWHGPTLAFKDMALQILPHLMTHSLRETGDDKEAVILVATSGDTGKAALEGFKDVEGTRVIVFYPHGGVSSMQELQMRTQEGANLHLAAVKGNFDDTQSGVKTIFGDQDFLELMEKNNKRLSSANSINWGRLLPQMVYYISAYLDLLEDGSLKAGESFNVVVPTGNFGNILAAYYAKNMGLPIDKLICASNKNNILKDFIETGVYDLNRDFYRTISPSMDILISSNLERLLFELADGDDSRVRKWMDSLAHEGKYSIDEVSLRKLQNNFIAGYADEENTRVTILESFKDYNYVLDTHTAVGKYVLDNYRLKTGDHKKALLVSTASPFKFGRDVLKALKEGESLDNMDDFDILLELSKISQMEIPKRLLDLKIMALRHDKVIEIDEMKDMVVEALDLEE